MIVEQLAALAAQEQAFRETSHVNNLTCPPLKLQMSVKDDAASFDVNVKVTSVQMQSFP